MDNKSKNTIEKRHSKEKDKILEQLKKMPIIQIVCERAGVGRATFYRWRKEDAEFKKATDEAIAEGEMLITDMSESQLISLIRDRNFAAIQLWLRQHHPKYTNKVEIDGHLTCSDEELTPEQANIVKQALRFASFEKNYGKEKEK